MDKKIEDFLRQAMSIGMTEEESLRIRKMMEKKMAAEPVRAANAECLRGDMTDIDPSFLTAARNIRLDEKEAQNAQKRLAAFMDEHPVDMAAAVRTNERRGWADVRSLLHLRFGPIAAAVLVLIGAGGGVSFAAENAVPGDMLYPVKVHVNDAVKTSLAFSPAAKAQVDAQIANERLREAEQLAARGKLTPDTSSSLASSFRSKLDDAHQAIATIAASGETQAAADIDAQVEQSLQNHTAILDTLAQDASGDALHGEIAVVLQNVRDADNKTIAFQKTLDGNGQIAVNIPLPSGAIDAGMTESESDSTNGNDHALRIQINEHVDEHQQTSGGNDQNITMHTFAGNHTDVSNAVQGLSILKTGSGAASSGSGSSSMKEQSSDGTVVHIENNDSTQVNTNMQTNGNSTVQINSDATTNVTNDVHLGNQ